jgi:hypothetical protein
MAQAVSNLGLVEELVSKPCCCRPLEFFDHREITDEKCTGFEVLWTTRNQLCRIVLVKMHVWQLMRIYVFWGVISSIHAAYPIGRAGYALSFSPTQVLELFFSVLGIIISLIQRLDGSNYFLEVR